MRPTWVEVDLAAIRHNVMTIRAHVAPATVMAVVKADGYGHGDVPVAMAAIEAGAEGVAVALVSEGIRLREAGIEQPILLLSEPLESDIADLRKWNITPSVYRSGFVAAIDGSAPLRVEIVVDTGMHRVGATVDEAVDLAKQITAGDAVELDGIWTHFAVAETEDSFNDQQIAEFNQCVSRIKSMGIDPGTVHLSNSAGAIYLKPEANRVRVGLAMYGIHPDPSRKILDLRPAMRVVSHVSHVRRYPAGTRPSYGRITELGGAAAVATVPIGYADGVPRSLGRRGGEVLIGGVRMEFAGNVTMDQVVVDCGSHDVGLGDEVVLIGGQGDDHITADEWADLSETISYEITTRMGPRLPRKYTD